MPHPPECIRRGSLTRFARGRRRDAVIYARQPRDSSRRPPGDIIIGIEGCSTERSSRIKSILAVARPLQRRTLFIRAQPRGTGNLPRRGRSARPGAAVYRPADACGRADAAAGCLDWSHSIARMLPPIWPRSEISAVFTLFCFRAGGVVRGEPM